MTRPPRYLYLPPVPRVRPAGSWNPLIGFVKVRRPQSVPVGRFLRPVQGIPLTGGQGASVISSASSSGGPVLVQTATGTITSGTTITITLTHNTTAGNCLIAYIGASQGTTNPVTSGITLGGSAGNWAAAKQALANADINAEIWVDWNCAGGQTSVVITFTAGTGLGQANGARIEEWSGIQSVSTPVDQTAGGNGSSTTPSSGATGTLSQASELVVGVIAAGGSPAGPASPWTNEAVVAVGSIGVVSGWQIVSATTAQTYAGTTSPSNPWGAICVSLKATPVVITGVAGLATISVGPQGLGNVWYPAQVTVQTSSGAADASTCSIYLGPAGVPVTLVATIFPGGIGTAALAVPPMQPGDYLIAQWTGGNPGDAAAVNVIGTMDSLMPG